MGSKRATRPARRARGAPPVSRTAFKRKLRRSAVRTHLRACDGVSDLSDVLPDVPLPSKRRRLIQKRSFAQRFLSSAQDVLADVFRIGGTGSSGAHAAKGKSKDKGKGNAKGKKKTKKNVSPASGSPGASKKARSNAHASGASASVQRAVSAQSGDAANEAPTPEAARVRRRAASRTLSEHTPKASNDTNGASKKGRVARNASELVPGALSSPNLTRTLTPRSAPGQAGAKAQRSAEQSPAATVAAVSKKLRTRPKSVPPLRAFVPRSILEGGTAPPFKRDVLSRFFRSLRPNAAVRVERFESGVSASVLYAPEVGRSRRAFEPTMLVSQAPRADDRSLVYQDSPYEIRVAGMSVRNYDRWGPSGDNELLMYSVQTDATMTGDANPSLPFIHYNFERDGTANSEKPNTYVPIPASKSYVMSSSGGAQATAGAAGAKKSVNVQFRILELDAPNDMVKAAVKSVDELGGFVSSFSSVAPFLGVLSPALGLASSVSKRALDSYSAPDKVISIDMDFMLAERERVRRRTAPPGEYLRYGYYFFLSEPIEGKLYASVRTPKNVQLMLKRLDRQKMGERARTDTKKRYFPLTEVSYLVVRVTEPTEAARVERKPIQMSHAKQLENIFQQSKLETNPEAIRNAVLELGKELGVLPDITFVKPKAKKKANAGA